MLPVVINILVFAHLMGLVLGMGSGVALATVGRVQAERPETVLDRVAEMLRMNSHVGLALLWISGPLILWLRYGGFGGVGVWFWLKLAGVVVLTVAVGLSTMDYRRVKRGDTSVLGRAKLLSAATTLSAIWVVFSAVFAFG